MTPRQDRFVQEYLIDLNATQAAIRAGYSERTANEQGAQLLAKPKIAAAIDKAKAERADRARIDAFWVLRRLVDEAEADLADLHDADGNLLPIHDWPKIWRQGLVQGIEVEELFEGRGEDRERVGTLRKVRLDNRVKRIELIGKHIDVSAFVENVNHAGLDGLAERLERAQMCADFETQSHVVSRGHGTAGDPVMLEATPAEPVEPAPTPVAAEPESLAAEPEPAPAAPPLARVRQAYVPVLPEPDWPPEPGQSDTDYSIFED